VSRQLDIRINAASETGYVVWENGEIVAGVSSAAELARWVEDRARQLDGEHEDISADPVTMPNVVAPRRGLWGSK